MNDLKSDLQDLERRIRSWTSRPPSRSAAAARTRVLARLGERRARGGWRLAAGVAVVALALVAGLYLRRPPAPPGIGPRGPSTVVAESPAAGRPAPGRPAPGLLIYELRSGTKLYLSLARSRPANGPAAESAFRR